MKAGLPTVRSDYNFQINDCFFILKHKNMNSDFFYIITHILRAKYQTAAAAENSGACDVRIVYFISSSK